MKISINKGGNIVARWDCLACDYVYDEEKGDPDNGIESGTL